MAERLRIVLAEDAALIGEGLVAVLERAGHRVTSWVRDAPSVAAAVERDDPDLLLTDVRMPPGNATDGLEAALALRARRPGFPVLVLSQYIAREYARELLADGGGAVGYLLKERISAIAEFRAALTTVASGGTCIDPEVVATMLRVRRSGPLDRLTERERDVLARMAEGRSNAEIAAAMFVSEAAVAKHVGSLLNKLGLPADAPGNRRVRAVLAWLDAAPGP